MAYTVRDLFEAGAAPPALTRAPGGGPLFEYLAERLLESFDLPFGPATYLRLMHPRLPDGDVAILHGRAWRMVRQEGPASCRPRPRRATPVTCSHGGTVWCFFRTAYRFKDPWSLLAALAR
jgi:hypothetical protein